MTLIISITALVVAIVGISVSVYLMVYLWKPKLITEAKLRKKVSLRYPIKCFNGVDYFVADAFTKATRVKIPYGKVEPFNDPACPYKYFIRVDVALNLYNERDNIYYEKGT